MSLSPIKIYECLVRVRRHSSMFENELVVVALIVASAIIVILLAVAILMAAVNTVRIDKAFKTGRRYGEQCGLEYLEAETDKYYLYEQFGKASKIGKSFLGALDMMRASLIVALSLLLIPIIMGFVSWNSSRLWPTRILLIVVLVWYLGAFAMWIQATVRLLKKNETNMFYQDNPDTAVEDLKNYRKNLLRFGIPIIGATAILGLVSFWLRTFAPEGSPDKGYLAETGWILLLASVAWTMIFVVYHWYATGFFKIAKTVNGDYFKKLIDDGTSGLKTHTNTLYKTFMPNTKQGKEVPRATGVLEETKAEVERMLLRHLATNIRGLDTSITGDDLSVVKKVADTDMLWKYMMHREGKELEDVRMYVQDKLGHITDDADVTAYLNGSPADTEKKIAKVEGILPTIRNIQNAMREIRGNTEVNAGVKRFVRQMLLLIGILVGVVLFAIFHATYQSNPGRTVMTWCIIVILLTIVMTAYGWINSAIRL